MKSQLILSQLLVSLLLLCVGPPSFSQANFWQQTSGPVGGRVSSLAVNPATQEIWAGTRGTGVFRSTDDGESWMPSNAGLTNLNVVALAITPATRSIFAGTFSGVFRSTDNGSNWTPANAGLSSVALRAFAINSFGHILAGTAAGIFRSANNGESWVQASSGLSSPDVRCFAINSTGYIFAGTFGGGVFRSTDNGNSWRSVTYGLMDNEEVYCLAIKPNAPEIFAGTRGHGVYRSTDNGESWLAVNTDLKNLYIRALTINASGHIFAGTDGDGVFRSTDKGQNWTPVNTGLTNLEIWALAIKTSGHIFAGTSSDGVFRSVRPTTAVRESAGERPVSFALEQNYPNPFWSGATSRSVGNPSTTIRFSLPRSGYVTLKVYNTLGAEVATLVAQKLPARSYEVKWDAGSLGSGLYYYRLQAEGFSQTKMLVLMK